MPDLVYNEHNTVAVRANWAGRDQYPDQTVFTLYRPDSTAAPGEVVASGPRSGWFWLTVRPQAVGLYRLEVSLRASSDPQGTVVERVLALSCDAVSLPHYRWWELRDLLAAIVEGDEHYLAGEFSSVSQGVGTSPHLLGLPDNHFAGWWVRLVHPESTQSWRDQEARVVGSVGSLGTVRFARDLTVPTLPVRFELHRSFRPTTLDTYLLRAWREAASQSARTGVVTLGNWSSVLALPRHVRTIHRVELVDTTTSPPTLTLVPYRPQRSVLLEDSSPHWYVEPARQLVVVGGNPNQQVRIAGTFSPLEVGYDFSYVDANPDFILHRAAEMCLVNASALRVHENNINALLAKHGELALEAKLRARQHVPPGSVRVW